ncbi:hypothetical protein BDZ89DRAFT_1156185 [Hymenopellis radicata]|nr:hypothetical protein BDZ89DRAFT_1156185 [Hymenopellis radicata]
MPVVAMSFELPKTQHALAAPEKWNQDWETLLKKGLITPRVCLSDLTNTWRLGIDEMYHSYSVLHSSTCEIQYRVGVRAMHYYERLETAWMNSTRQERRKHVLIGMSTVCSKARNLNDARGYCGDYVRLEKLSREPATFLDFLKTLILDDLSKVPGTPRYIPHAEWDRYSAKIEKSGTEMEKICMRYLIILRTKLIYMVLEFSFLSFLGEPLPELTVLKQRGGPEPDDTAGIPLEVLKKMRELNLGKQQSKKVIKEDKIAQKARASKREVICTGCPKMQGPGESFQQCQRCKERMDRDIPYCSRECQVNHWKHHKIICGKPMNLETAIASAIPKVTPPGQEPSSPNGEADGALSPNVPPPKDGFKRSFALMKHVQYLNKYPKVDLVVRTGPASANVTQIDIPYPPVQSMFRIVRDAAMTTGSLIAVAMVCHYVAWFFVAKGMEGTYDIDCIAEQMAKEWETPVEELKRTVLELHEVYLEEPYNRPPIMSNLDPRHWAAFLAAGPLDMEKRIVFKD